MCDAKEKDILEEKIKNLDSQMAALTALRGELSARLEVSGPVASASPFKAKCICERRSSPLKKNEVVEVTGMSSEEECEKEILVDIQWQDREFAVPLMQLKGISVDEETEEAVADWHYWVGMRYEF